MKELNNLFNSSIFKTKIYNNKDEIINLQFIPVTQLETLPIINVEADISNQVNIINANDILNIQNTNENSVKLIIKLDSLHNIDTISKPITKSVTFSNNLEIFKPVTKPVTKPITKTVTKPLMFSPKNTTNRQVKMKMRMKF